MGLLDPQAPWQTWLTGCRDTLVQPGWWISSDLCPCSRKDLPSLQAGSSGLIFFTFPLHVQSFKDQATADRTSSFLPFSPAPLPGLIFTHRLYQASLLSNSSFSLHCNLPQDYLGDQFVNPLVVVQSLSRGQLCGTVDCSTVGSSVSHPLPWSLLRFMSVESVMLPNPLTLCRPLLLPSIFRSIRVFSMSQLFASGGQSIGASVHPLFRALNICCEAQALSWASLSLLSPV